MVDLPPPVGPTTPTNWPGSISKLTPLSTGDVGSVAELHLVEADRAPDRRRQHACVGSFRDHVVGVENGAHPIHSDRRLRDGIRHAGKVFHRLEKLGQIGREIRSKLRRSWCRQE